MRTIKFRGKVKYNGNNLFSGDWAFGSLVVNFHDGITKYFIATNGMGQIYATSYEVIPEAIGQFTGRVAEKAREVFEGDVLKISWLTPSRGGYFQSDDAWCENEVIAKVDFLGDRFVYVKKDGKQTSIKNGSTVEIIGNIHDNPELIK